MIAPRRFLPSIPSLLALEAVDRLGSVNGAADDLALTHSAVSRQLRVLQEQIGVELFLRQGKGLKTTASGKAYAQAIRDCLNDLARASLKIKAAGERMTLNLALLPEFGMSWLAPHLRALTQDHLDITLNLGTRLAPFDFEREGFDAALHFGQADWPGAHHLLLSPERLIPCCLPQLLPQAGSLSSLLDAPLLHLTNRPGAWEAWFASHGLQASGLRGALFDQYASLLEGARLGFGIALLPDHLAEPELTAGRLIKAWPDYIPSEGSYYLVWPKHQAVSRPLALLLARLQA